MFSITPSYNDNIKKRLVTPESTVWTNQAPSSRACSTPTGRTPPCSVRGSSVTGSGRHHGRPRSNRLCCLLARSNQPPVTAGEGEEATTSSCPTPAAWGQPSLCPRIHDATREEHPFNLAKVVFPGGNSGMICASWLFLFTMFRGLGGKVQLLVDALCSQAAACELEERRKPWISFIVGVGEVWSCFGKYYKLPTELY